MESNPSLMCELMMGLPATTILGLDDVEDGLIRVHLERSELRTSCPACGVVADFKVRCLVELADRSDYGQSRRLLGHSVASFVELETVRARLGLRSTSASLILF